MSRVAIAALFLLAVMAGTVLGVLPAIIVIGYALLSAVSWLMYAWDKSCAERGARRTPESRLHWIDLLGGWPGGLIGQQISHHKTIKTSFQVVFWCTVAANLAAVAWLVHSGIAAELTAALRVLVAPV